MSDREALAAALENGDPYPSNYTKHDFALLVAAARERRDQLPEKCEHGKTGPHWVGPTGRKCSGKVYPAELVERIAKALLHWDEDGKVHPLEGGHYAEGARFVLDALNGETE